MKNILRNLLKSFLVMVFILTSPAYSQENVQANSGHVIFRNHLADSLQQELITIQHTTDSLQSATLNANRKIELLQAENEKLIASQKEMDLKLAEALGDKRQSSHTSSVLFIFNVLIGIFLLLAMLWMFIRRKGPVAETEREPVQPKLNGYTLPLEHQLEQIEKLGSLREKGLLNDEEFNLQKRQILGERH